MKENEPRPVGPHGIKHINSCIMGDLEDRERGRNNIEEI